MLNAYNIILMITSYFFQNIMYSPTLGDVAVDLATTNELAKATMTSYQFGAFFACLAAVFLGDYFGKKNYLVFGLSLAIIGSVICMLAPNIETLIVGRAIQGVGGVTGFMMGFALAVDLYKPDETTKIVALNGVVVAFTNAITPYLGGYISVTYSWRVNFMVMIAVLLVSLTISILNLPKKANTRKESIELGKSLREMTTIITNLRFLAYGTLNGIFITGFIFSASFLPLYLPSAFKMTSDSVGLVIGLGVWFTFGVTSFFSTRLYNRFGVDQVISAAIWLIGASVVFIYLTGHFFPTNLYLNIASLTLYSLGFGFLYSGSISRCMRVFEELSTKSSAIRTIMLTAGSFVGAYSAQIMSSTDLLSLIIVLTLTFAAGRFMFSLRNM